MITFIFILFTALYVICLCFLVIFIGTNAKPDISETQLIDEPKMTIV